MMMNKSKENLAFESEIECIETRYGSRIVPKAEGDDITIPDNSDVIEKLAMEVSRVNRSYDHQRFTEAIASLDKKIGDLPTVMNIRHHLAPWSKGFIISAVVLLLIACTSTYLAITYRAENRVLKREARKYYYVEMLYPVPAALINYEIDYRPAKLDQRVCSSREKTTIRKKSKSSTNLKSNEK
ncbi:MAG: hypothetical protein V4594_24605 [Bacteroidota bacterium]